MVTCSCLVFAGPARTQQPSPATLATAKELVDIIGASRDFDPIVTGVIVQTATTFLNSNPALAKDLNDIAELLVSEYLPRRDEVKNDMIRLYAQRLTDQELKDALAFFKAPLGKKLLAENQIILSETAKRADAWAVKFRDEVAGRIRAELKKKGHNL
jgi:hypothetical protein